MDNNEALKNFLKEKVAKDLILKHIFLKTLEEKYDDEYINMVYKLNADKIRTLYNELDKEEVKRLEEKIIKQINAGEINLKKEAANWHREALVKDSIGKKEKEGEGR